MLIVIKCPECETEHYIDIKIDMIDNPRAIAAIDLNRYQVLP